MAEEATITLEHAFHLAQQHHEQGRLGEAELLYRRILQAAPQQADTLHYLGVLLHQTGREDEGFALMSRALQIQPNQASFWGNIGALLSRMQRWQQAVPYLERALQLNADFLEGWQNLGTAYLSMGRYPQAGVCFEQILRLRPELASTWFHLGMTLHLQGKEKEALPHYQKALTLQPDFPEALLKLGNIHEGFKKPEDAIPFYQEALRLKPDYGEAIDFLLHAKMSVCDWDGIDSLFPRFPEAVRRDRGAWMRPFTLLSIPSTPEEQLLCAQQWAALECAVPLQMQRQRPFEHAPRQSERLRIGYVSGDFFGHAVANLMVELFELHDRTRFEIRAYSWSKQDNSAVRARIVQSADAFIEVGGLHYEEIARRIHQDQVDILVDLKGYTTDPRTEIFALRPAPIQVNWLGYPGTMGADFIDYLVADPFLIPEGAEAGYSERVMRMPHCYQINDRRRPIQEPAPSRAAVGLPETGFVFCCFNQLYKILPEMFAVWMRLLRETPGSVLWLMGQHPRAMDNLKRAAQMHGVDSTRLLFAPKAPIADHLARYRLADLALDTFPYTSHTTASDALWAGCPIATCAGSTFASRVAGSILTSAGLPELVTTSLGDYEALLLALAHDPQRREALRRKVQANRDNCPLFDSPRFARDLEVLYERMWEERGLSRNR